MHSYLVRSGELGKAVSPAQVHVHTHEDGWVGSLEGVKTLKRDYMGRVLSPAGRNRAYAVVHRYERAGSVLSDSYSRQYPIIPQNELIGK